MSGGGQHSELLQLVSNASSFCTVIPELTHESLEKDVKGC